MAYLSLGSGTKNVPLAGTAQALSASEVACRSVVIQADPSNTGLIYVGDSNVSSTRGVELSASQTISFSRTDPQINLFDIYIDASVNGEGVRFVYIL